MTKPDRTPAGAALTDLVLDVFRVASRMTTAGDRLVAGLGLTSARWQVLGSMTAAARPQPVAWLARDMGVSRQNLQRIIHDLEAEGLVAFETNPHHRRSRLVGLTARGHEVFAAAMALQAPWAEGLARGLTREEIVAAHGVMMAWRQRLEENAD